MHSSASLTQSLCTISRVQILDKLQLVTFHLLRPSRSLRDHVGFLSPGRYDLNLDAQEVSQYAIQKNSAQGEWGNQTICIRNRLNNYEIGKMQNTFLRFNLFALLFKSTFKLTCRAFRRRFYPKWITITEVHLSKESKTTIYHCLNSRDVLEQLPSTYKC